MYGMMHPTFVPYTSNCTDNSMDMYDCVFKFQVRHACIAVLIQRYLSVACRISAQCLILLVLTLSKQTRVML